MLTITNYTKSSLWKADDKILNFTPHYKSTHFPQHLYILSNEEIKEGDWMLVYNPILGQSHFIVKVENIKQAVKGKGFEKYNQKIIATTDTLSLNYDLHKDSIYLPQPSSQFIQKYIEEYNKGNIITEYMVEYDNHLPDTDGDFGKIQINSDNTINIKTVKNNWLNIKQHGKTLEDWKLNAEENYLTTPISVLKYITCLEETLNNQNL
jgi:hypothetical protein